MAATDMRKAGLEPGCLVEVLHPDNIQGSLATVERERLIALGARNPWTYLRPKSGPYLTLEQRDQEPGEMPAVVDVHRDDFVRQYDDAQTARQTRFEKLLAVFPGDAGVPEETDTVERFVLVQKIEGPTGGGSHAFQWGDTFDAAVDLAGGEILDGWNPLGVFDLDTGEKIDLHISSPVITQSEDQGATVNELDAEAMADLDAQVEQDYDLIAHQFTASITVPPEHAEQMRTALNFWCSRTWVENANVREEQIRQLRRVEAG